MPGEIKPFDKDFNPFDTTGRPLTPLEEQEEAYRQAYLNHRRQLMEAMLQGLRSIQVNLAIGVANSEFPDEFRIQIKRQAMQIAANAEVVIP